MPDSSFPNDPLWPRAAHWLAGRSPAAGPGSRPRLAFLGVPTHTTSITPTGAHTTPAAVRAALMRYSTWATDGGCDIAKVAVADLGDVTDPDGPAGEERVLKATSGLIGESELVLAIGGDNSLTHAVLRGLAGEDGLADWALITVDAHHDLRDGESNGSPVRRLLDAGLPGDHVVQIGIADFSNSPAYAARAREAGITIVPRAELRGADLDELAGWALEIAAADGRPVYVDLDVDVCDRAAVPGCPAAAPGGISADELRHLARAFACDARVRAMDITEVDASSDSGDGRTVRLAALLVLEIAAGLASRESQRA